MNYLKGVKTEKAESPTTDFLVAITNNTSTKQKGSQGYLISSIELLIASYSFSETHFPVSPGKGSQMEALSPPA